MKHRAVAVIAELFVQLSESMHVHQIFVVPMMWKKT